LQGEILSHLDYDEFKTIEMGVLCGRYGESRDAYSVLLAKSEGKGPLGRPRHKWEHHIDMDLPEVSWEYGLD
jgi:hypothetical protein